MYTQTVHVYMYIRDQSFIREGGGGGGWRVSWYKWLEVVPFYTPGNGGLHKILQSVLSSQVFLYILISFLGVQLKAAYM